MKQIRHSIEKHRRIWFAALGFSLGLVLVVIASAGEAGSFLEAQVSTPYLWVLDTLPFVLAYCGAMVAIRGSESDAGKQIWTLHLLILALTFIPFCMIVYGFSLNKQSEGYLQDIRSANSIRFRSLWLRNQLQAQFGELMMKPTVDELVRTYPKDTLDLQNAWGELRDKLIRNDYQPQTGINLSAAANRLGRRIEVLRQELLQRVSSNFRLGMASLLLTLATGIGLIRRLAQAEKRIYDQARELSDRQARLESANKRLGRIANHDSLTGLHNHRAFQERLKEEFSRAQRYTFPLSLLIIDVDRFKQWNDKHGHMAGDEILKTVATVLKDACRNVDFVARYGGEEFVILLPHTQRMEATVIAERLRAAVATSGQVTVSIGASTYDLNDVDTAELLTQADLAMYESKRKGRNRIMHYADVPASGTAVVMK